MIALVVDLDAVRRGVGNADDGDRQAVARAQLRRRTPPTGSRDSCPVGSEVAHPARIPRRATDRGAGKMHGAVAGSSALAARLAPGLLGLFLGGRLFLLVVVALLLPVRLVVVLLVVAVLVPLQGLVVLQLLLLLGVERRQVVLLLLGGLGGVLLVGVDARRA